ncbi:MAG TPA: Maf family nucleotide pyrophosphatase [Fulvivirga sp.]|nr:Maf family nucleotide pyrophosphatase [Fulvivirga sp.]
MNFDHPLILASKSPRRQQLLSEAGFKFVVKSVEVDESYPIELDPKEVAKYLAEKKAKASQQELTNELLIAADTVVIVDNQLLGKPITHHDAKRMLRLMSGRTHLVITGVAIASNSKLVSFDDTTEVTFKVLTDDEIDHYINEYKPFDKAGAYGIQEWIGMIGIVKIEGSFFNVVGLPVHKVYEELNKMKALL